MESYYPTPSSPTQFPKLRNTSIITGLMKNDYVIREATEAVLKLTQEMHSMTIKT